MPLGIIALLWSTAQLLNFPNRSFGEVFGTGDLLPLGALLLLSVSADIRIADDATAGVWMAVHEVLFIVLAICSITIYGPLRTSAFELVGSGSTESQQALRAFGIASWTYVGYAVFHAVPVKAILLRNSNVRRSNGT